MVSNIQREVLRCVAKRCSVMVLRSAGHNSVIAARVDREPRAVGAESKVKNVVSVASLPGS